MTIDYSDFCPCLNQFLRPIRLMATLWTRINLTRRHNLATQGAGKHDGNGNRGKVYSYSTLSQS